MKVGERNKAEETSDVAPAMAARLDVVSKLYGNFAALRKLSVEFAVGSSTVVLGDNGAGKSTLLRMLAGLIAPTRGTVSVFGAEPKTHRRRIAYMSHEAMLYDELSALENLRYFARLQAQRGECACGGPERSLRAVGLDPLLKRPVGQYSQGMRQRASLARVLQADPELLLLDEPFSNLDVDSARRMVELLVEFRSWPVIGATNVTGAADDQTLRGRTIILTTHQAHLAEPLAETTLTMRGGAVASMISRATSDPAQAKEDAR
jgi:ABC-type multidrug transport system ATPase subunit